MKLILLRRHSLGDLCGGLRTLLVVLSLLLFFACSDPLSNGGNLISDLIKSDIKEITGLVVHYNGINYLPDSLSDDITLELSIPRVLGDTSPTLDVTTAKVSSITVSPKASYDISDAGDIDLNNLSAITIDVTAEDGSTKRYNLELTVNIYPEILITNTYASSTQAILGQGFIDTVMESDVEVITASNLLPGAAFNWKLKDAADNELVAGNAPKIGDLNGEITILQSEFYLAAKNRIKNLISGTNTEEALTLELEYLGASAEKAIKTVVYSPYKLFTWHDVQAMRVDLAGDYVLQQDVAFPNMGEEGFTIQGFEPVGNDTNPISGFQGTAFSGSLDGNGKMLTNFFSKRLGLNYVGLFGYVDADGKEIKDFTIRHVGIQGSSYVGTIAGQLKKGTITNVEVAAVTPSDKIMGSVNYTGGLVGYVGDPSVTSGSTTVKGYVSGDVDGNNDVGGLVGSNYVTGTVIGYTTGDVDGNNIVGGLVGNNRNMAIGYATGTITGNSNVGGLVGFHFGELKGYFRGAVKRTGTVLSFGFIAGDSSAGATVPIGYYSSTEANFSGNSGINFTGINGAAVIIDGNTTESTFTGFTFNAIGVEGNWTFVDSKWPALNIGTVKPVSDQPIDP